MSFTFSRASALALPILSFAALAGAEIGGVLTDRAWAADAAPAMIAIDTEADSSELASDDSLPRFAPLETKEGVGQQPAAASLPELIASMGQDAPMAPQMRCLAGAIYFESRGEPLEGQLAVGQVVVNRADSELFPDDYCGVVTQRSQFSFVRNGRIPEPNKSSAAWHQARAIAQIVHQGLWDSRADDSLYFHATYVKPRWSRRKVARATINRHVFYR
jgi:spore germination cell wall hydrolase CwlJ-like protein